MRVTLLSVPPTLAEVECETTWTARESMFVLDLNYLTFIIYSIYLLFDLHVLLCGCLAYRSESCHLMLMSTVCQNGSLNSNEKVNRKRDSPSLSVSLNLSLLEGRANSMTDSSRWAKLTHLELLFVSPFKPVTYLVMTTGFGPRPKLLW